MSAECDFDEKEALARLDNDYELFNELIGIFDGEYPIWIRNISEAISESNSPQLAHHAHAIKGALANIGALKGSEKALLLELKGKNGEMDGAVEVLKELENAVSAFRAAVNRSLS